MRYYLCCKECNSKDLEMDSMSYYVCEECGEKNSYDDLQVEEE